MWDYIEGKSQSRAGSKPLMLIPGRKEELLGNENVRNALLVKIISLWTKNFSVIVYKL